MARLEADVGTLEQAVARLETDMASVKESIERLEARIERDRSDRQMRLLAGDAQGPPSLAAGTSPRGLLEHGFARLWCSQCRSSAFVGEPIAVQDEKRLEDTAAYLVRNPLSLKKLVYLDGRQAVLYRSRMNRRSGETSRRSTSSSGWRA